MPARSARLRSPLVRALVVFLVAFIGLCILAGPERLTRPSHDNHYSWLAQGWLEGRLHHDLGGRGDDEARPDHDP